MVRLPNVFLSQSYRDRKFDFIIHSLPGKKKNRKRSVYLFSTAFNTSTLIGSMRNNTFADAISLFWISASADAKACCLVSPLPETMTFC